MSKLILSIILILSAFMVGNTCSFRLINRRRTLGEILVVINKIKNQIKFGCIDAPDIITNTLCTEDFPLLDITFDNAQDIGKQLRNAVDNIRKSFSLNNEDKDLLFRFCSGLGSTDVEGQIAHIELYTGLFNEQLDTAREQEKIRAKLYRVLGFSFGLALSLIII